MLGKPLDPTTEDLTQYDPILLEVGIRAPKYVPLRQTSPVSKSTLRLHRGDSLIFRKDKKAKPDKRLGVD